MVDADGFTAAVLAAMAATDGGHREAVGAVCRACVRFAPVTGAAVTVMTGPGARELLWATDTVAARIDELQYALGEGPCVDAFTSGRPVLISDIADPRQGERWPVFAAAAAGTAARGMYVFPLQVGADRLGVLDCYRDTPGELGPSALTTALRAADMAVLGLLKGGIEEARVGPTPADHPDPHPAGPAPGDGHPAGRGVGPADPGGRGAPQASEFLTGTEHPFAGMVHRDVHQATGVITEQAGISAAEALARLRAAAFAAGRSLDDTAADVLARRLRFDTLGNGVGADSDSDGEGPDRGEP